MDKCSLLYLLKKYFDPNSTFLNKLEQAHIFDSWKTIYLNPLAERWNLCKSPIDYQYSSAACYETGIDCFLFLKAVCDEF